MELSLNQGISLENEKQYLYWLCHTPGMGAVSIRKLGEYFTSFERIYQTEEKELQECRLLKARQIDAIQQSKRKFSILQEEYTKLEEQQIRFLTPLDEEYPKRLRNIYDPPMGLYVKGTLPDDGKPSVAIVGARGCSAYGEQLAEIFAQELAKEGVQIISGLAMGIDGAAHRGALKVNRPTFGILGCGINICYPSAHYGLYEQMVHQGGVLSEFALGQKPDAFHFPMRNRIISGLSDAILVVEAKEKSGSLITAEIGLEQGKEIFAVPGRVTDALSSGCNHLIQQGAQVAISPADLLEYLGVKHEKKLILHEKNVNVLAKKEKMVYSCLDFKPKHIEEILSQTGLSIGECMSSLMELELGGYAFRFANHYYGKKL